MNRKQWHRVQREPAGTRRFPMFGATTRLFEAHAIWLSEGGWCGRKWMTTKELVAALDRWVDHAYLAGGEKYAEEVANEGGRLQCGGCRYFAAFDSNYGLCCNVKSNMDGRVTFEHAGCPQHSNLELPNA